MLASLTDILTVFNGLINIFFFTISIKISEQNIETETLIDSGAGSEFIDQNYARSLKLSLQELAKLIPALNVDGNPWQERNHQTLCQSWPGYLWTKTNNTIIGNRTWQQKIILRFPWLQKHNPIINWQTGTFEWQYISWTVDFRKHIKDLLAKLLPKPTITKEEDSDKWLMWTVNVPETDCQNTSISPLIEIQEQIMDEGAWENSEMNSVWICSKTNLVTNMVIAENLKKEDLNDKQIVPPEFHKYLDIFDKKWASWFPDKQPWNLKIEMKPGFKPKLFKNYDLTPAEQNKLDKFLKENLEKGYIQKSESPMASTFFFVKKKDGKLWPCQDYWFLNEWMIKNAYPLPLISEIMDKLKGAKYHKIGCLMEL